MSHDVTTMAVNGTLPVSRRNRERWSPPGVTEREYELAPVTVIERSKVVEAVKRTVGEFPSDEMLRWTLQQAALAVLDPEEAAQASRTITELSALEGAGDKSDPEVQEALATMTAAVGRLRTELSWEDEKLRRVLSARDKWTDGWLLCTARAVIRDWQGLDAPCVRKNGLVTEDAMSAVPDEDLPHLIARCHDWTEVSRDQEPGSASP